MIDRRERPSGQDDGLFSRPYLLLTLTTLFWGGNAVAGKLAVGEISFITLNLLRWLLACLFMLPFAWRYLVADWATIKQHGFVLFLLGSIGLSGFSLCMFWALNYTSVVNVVIEQAAIPVLIMLCNFLLFGLSIRWLQLAGLSIALIGVAITVSKGDFYSMVQQGVNIGDAIMMLAALCYAAYSIGLKWRPPMHWLSFLFCLSISAIPASLMFWLWEVSKEGLQAIDLSGVWLVLYVVIFPSILSQLFYARGVELIGANRAGLFINLVPIFGSLLAVVLIGERFLWFHAAGMAMVIGGIATAERSARSKSVE